MSSEKRIMFDNIDDVLGAKEKRFLGDGYRKISRQLNNVAVSSESASAIASVIYPSDWSKKGSEELKPHLSSIDALVFSVQLSEAFLMHKYKLNDAKRKKMWLRNFTIKTGTTPIEDLASVPVTLQQHTNQAITAVSNCCNHVAQLEVNIGNMNICSEIEHDVDTSAVNDVAGYFANIEDILGPKNDRYYGVGYETTQQKIDSIVMDMENQTVSSHLGIVSEQRERCIDMEASYKRPDSSVDLIVVVTQLAQCLIYEMDHINRTSSNNLWLREMKFTNTAPYQDLQIANDHAYAKITKAKCLKMKGATWRICDIDGQYNNMHLKYSVAHALPNN